MLERTPSWEACALKFFLYMAVGGLTRVSKSTVLLDCDSPQRWHQLLGHQLHACAAVPCGRQGAMGLVARERGGVNTCCAPFFHQSLKERGTARVHPTPFPQALVWILAWNPLETSNERHRRQEKDSTP